MDVPTSRTVRIGWVVFLCVVVLILLRLVSAVFVPLALALFTIALAWPLQCRLEKWRFPRPLAYVFTLLSVLVVVGIFAGLIYACARNVAEKAPDYRERFSELHQEAKRWMAVQRRKAALDLDDEPEAAPASDEPDPSQASGGGGALDTSPGAAGAPPAGAPGESTASSSSGNGGGNNNSDPSGLMDFAGKVLAFAYGLVGQLALLITFTILGLIEIHRFTEKLERRLPSPAGITVRDICSEIASKLQRYMMLRTLISATTGVLVWLFTWLIGLEFPLVWGVLSFLLNYIPTLGSIVAVIPPTLFAGITGDASLFLTTLAGLTVIQFTIGNLLDPRLEGRVLRLSPLLLFLSMVFWGWMWGIPGALLGIPILSAIFIVCRRFDATRPIADVLEK